MTTLRHGQKNTRLYMRWSSIKRRCNNPNDKAYQNYGARGIKMCTHWEADFVNFYNWAHANGYARGLDLDRIDNDSGYEPSNCRFVDRKTNVQNSRASSGWVVEGVKYKSSYDAAKANNVSATTIRKWCNNKAKADCRRESKYEQK